MKRWVSTGSAAAVRRRRSFRYVAAVLLVFSQCLPLRADVVTLTDGRQIEGKFTQLNAMQAGAGAAPTPGTKLIMMSDDGLRRTYFGKKMVQAYDPSPNAGTKQEEINVPQRVARTGQRIGGVGAIIQITPWDETSVGDDAGGGFGRRTFSMVGGPTGRLDVIQGITKITPLWCSVEALQTPSQAYVWEMRVATSSIPREVISAIIKRQIDPKDADQRLKVVRLFLQQERYADAEAELNAIMQEFPDRANLAEVAKELKQLAARQVLSEIETRSKGGQHQLAYQWLQNFKTDGVSGQILQQVRAKFDEYNEAHLRGQAMVQQLNALVKEVKDPVIQRKIEPLVKEVCQQLTYNTLDRMATFRRFADDNNSSAEQKLSLAVSGWLMGANDASENILSTLAIAEMRDLVIEYLRADIEAERQQVLAKIRAQEAASPTLIAALLKRIPPVLDLPSSDKPGEYELSVASVPGEADVNYRVLLPPEYDRHSSYPCIITLHGGGSTPEHQIEWWAGAAPPPDRPNLRVGQASRHGYIVIAPEWGKPHQKEFESSAREHHAVLSVLRDACRHFAIDTDRVFLSGHSMGAVAAWEIGLAHPDLWAGVIPIAPKMSKTSQSYKIIAQYWENAALVPMYFVGGEQDGDSMLTNSLQFERYLNRVTAFDVTAVEYLGRGHEHFSDEILRIFDWMGRKRRDFFPRSFEVKTQRETDSFFWWIELPSFTPTRVAMKITSRLHDTNGLSITCGPKPIVWLSPEMVDFARPFTVTLNGRPMLGARDARPDVGVLLEDARSRGERKHPFWAKIE